MAIKNKKWLPENNYLDNLNPKEQYANTFKSIIKTIKENESSIREGIVCPFCNERNIGIRKVCYKCGRKIKHPLEIWR